MTFCDLRDGEIWQDWWDSVRFYEIWWDLMRFGDIQWDMVRCGSKYGHKSVILNNKKKENVQVKLDQKVA